MFTMSTFIRTAGVLGTCVLSGVAGAVFGHDLCRPVTVAAPPPAAMVTVPPCPSASSIGCVRNITQSGGTVLVATVLPPGWDGWQRIDPETANVLRTGGDAEDRATRDWTLCYEHGGDTATITCPDGHVETS